MSNQLFKDCRIFLLCFLIQVIKNIGDKITEFHILFLKNISPEAFKLFMLAFLLGSD